MLSMLFVRLAIKVKVGIAESFKVGWYPHKITGSSHLKTRLIFPRVNDPIVRFVQSFYYTKTVSSVSTLFSWHKNFGGVIKWHNFLHGIKVSHGETKGELEQTFNSN